MKNRFQAFAFKFNLYRYTEGAMFAFGPTLVGMFSSEPAIVAAAGGYLRWNSGVLVFLALEAVTEAGGCTSSIQLTELEAGIDLVFKSYFSLNRLGADAQLESAWFQPFKPIT